MFVFLNELYLGSIAPPWAGARLCSGDAVFRSHWARRNDELDVADSLHAFKLLQEKKPSVLPLCPTQLEPGVSHFLINGAFEVTGNFLRSYPEENKWNRVACVL